MKLYLWLRWGWLVLAALLVGGCFAVTTMAPRGDNQQIPKYHVWDTLTGFGGEEQGYVLYTYVILGGNVTTTATQEGRRNQSLLDAIVDVTARPGEALGSPDNPTGFLKQECNIFYIPMTQRKLPQSTSPLSLYNMPLARQLKADLVRAIQENQEISQRLQNNPGPFLVSVPVPLPGIKTRATKLLVADLSITHPAAMRQVIAGYRQQLNAHAIDDVERFRSVRLALLEGILALNDITIVKAALSDIIPSDGGRH